MEDLFQRLENQIRSLIKQHDVVKQSNAQLVHDKDILQTKNKLAITYIEDIVTQLKTIESSE